MSEQTMAVQRMQDYIIAHYTEAITLAELAEAAMFSPWYAHRLFREQTGISPAEYIRRLRLTEAAKRLKCERCRIIDVAMELGFGSIDVFTRAFEREFAMRPSEYKLKPVPIMLFVPYAVKFREMRKDEISMEAVAAVKNVFIQVIRKPERKVIIKRAVKAEDY